MKGWARDSRRMLVVLIAVAVVAAAASAWLGTRVKSPAQAAAEAAPPPASVITAPVERRTLRSTLVLRGTVRARQLVRVTVEPRVEDGRVVVTAAPLRRGATVSEGDLLAEVSGRPVFALQGRVPMYRDLRRGAEGDDVEQLQAALGRLGFTPWEWNGRFGAGTEAAVRRFYLANGYPPVTEPTPSPARQEGGGATSSTSAEQPGKQPDRVVVPWSEVVFLARLPARVVTAPAVGQEPSGPLLTLTSANLAAELPLAAVERRLVEVGAKAVVEAESSGIRFRGSVTAIDARRAAGGAGSGQEVDTDLGDQGGDGGGQTHVARITGSRALDPRLLDQEVKATIEVDSTRKPVLVVPEAAVWARADGFTYVTRVAGDGRQTTVGVEAGLSADGFVEVTPVAGTLRPGDQVLVGMQERP